MNEYLKWYCPEGSHYRLRPKAIMVARRSIPLQATLNLIIKWLLGSTLTPGFNQAIMGLIRILWDLLGHYGSAILVCASPGIQYRPVSPV